MAGNRKQPERNPVGGGHGWGNENAPTSSPRTLGVTGGAAGILTKQATTLTEEDNATKAGKTAQDLHMVMMGGNRMLNNTVRVGNSIVGATRTAKAPISGQQQGAERGSTGWSALTEAVEKFGPAATMQDFSEKILKWQADVKGGLTKCATFNIQAVEAENLRVFVGMVKGDVEL